MEREDFIIGSSSAYVDAPILPESTEPAVQTVTTETLIPRSTSLEDLQAMVAASQALETREVFAEVNPTLQDLKKLMKQEFRYLLERSRQLPPDDYYAPLFFRMMDILKKKHAAIRNLNKQDFATFRIFLLGVSNAPIFVPGTALAQNRGVSLEALSIDNDFIYSARYLSDAYQTFLRGEPVFTSRIPVNLHSTRFAHNIHPKLLHTQLNEISAEIFETVFNEYQDRPMMHRLKNVLLCLYAGYKIFPKLLSDCFRDEAVKKHCETEDIHLNVPTEYGSLFNWDTPRHGALWNFRNEHLGPIHTSDKLLSDFLKEFDSHQKELVSQPFYSFLMKYAEFYLSQHESFAAALENPHAFPDQLLLDFHQREGFDIAALSHSRTASKETFLLHMGRYFQEVFYFTRDHYRLIVDKMTYTDMVSVLQAKYKQLMTKRVRQDPFIAAIYSIIQPIFQKLQSIDLASPAYTREDVNAILRDLKTLRIYLDTLAGLVSFIKDGDLKIEAAKKQPPVKKKKPVRKKKKAPAPVIVAETSAPVPVPSPKKVAPLKLTPEKKKELDSIREISERIRTNLEKENQYYRAAKDYILNLMTNAQGKSLVETLFNPKSNLKNMMSQKEMTLIVEQMSSRIGAISENLKGSNGFRFRVGDEIYTSHASSAEIGHKGHGGAVKGFRDFLIAVYALSLKK
ncbi:MAG: hypothetical protein KBE16_07130 [Alphaproteobacteria bacterium]|jgi:hypothetical protein|nr:hypothetical protein [Alphaproteobacteria bacterium]MBP9878243.1 hypothetical protein [Alphaproteobacteria bacterium]